MSEGVTGGLDLTVETLDYIHRHWDGVALTFSQSSNAGVLYDTFQYDTVSYSTDNPWTRPVLRNHDDKTLYPNDEVTNYTATLRQNDVVTVEDGGRVDSPIGAEYDADVEYEVDVTCEAMPGNGFSVIEDSTDWRVFVNIVRLCILLHRNRPITDPECRYDWRWLTIANESTLPETEGNRNHFGTEFTARWHGYEALPSL